MGSVGPAELIIIMVIALLVFGPKKLPEIGRGLGSAIREFKRHSRDLMSYLDAEEPEPRRVYPDPSPYQPAGEEVPAPVLPPVEPPANTKPTSNPYPVDGDLADAKVTPAPDAQPEDTDTPPTSSTHPASVGTQPTSNTHPAE
jgi:sec-independent protein translocase protein TatA